MRNNEANEKTREKVAALVEAERQIDRKAGSLDARWEWVDKPSTGGPYLWNDIRVFYPDGSSKFIEAKQFVETA